MKRYFYPAVFHREEQNGYWVSFPDFSECLTQGETLEEAYKMATEALGLCLDEKLRNGEAIPSADFHPDIVLGQSEFSCLIEFNQEQYRRTHNTKAVKKTLSIPQWLNEAATAKGINFSQALQEALMQKIGML